MKKVILSTIAAAALTTSAMAELKIGVGADLAMGQVSAINTTTGAATANNNGRSMIRISLDGLADGVRIEPRLATASYTTTAGTNSIMNFGIGAYYDLTKTVAAGFIYDMYDNTDLGSSEGTNMTFVVKAEAEIGKNFSISYELGLNMNDDTTSSSSNMTPYSALTARMFF